MPHLSPYTFKQATLSTRRKDGALGQRTLSPYSANINKMMRLRVSSICGLALAVLAASLGLAQIPQERPELCGGSAKTVPLPAGTMFSFSQTASDFTFKLSNGATKTLDLDPAEEMLQVCPIAGDRLLVFGTVGGGHGPSIWIISRVDGAKLDVLELRSPTVSPDQQWVAYRRFYPRFSEICGDDYLGPKAVSQLRRRVVLVVP